MDIGEKTRKELEAEFKRTKGLFHEFKTFAMRGNVVDLAVGVIIGAAFGAIVNSLVQDILMPPLGLLTGGDDFAKRYVNLSSTNYPSLDAAMAAHAPVIKYGNFLHSVISFVIIAFSVFILVRFINKLHPPPPVATKECPFCISNIPLKATRCPQCTSQLT